MTARIRSVIPSSIPCIGKRSGWIRGQFLRDKLKVNIGQRRSVQSHPSSVATSSVAPPMARGRTTWRMRLEGGTCASLDDMATTAAAGLIVRPKCEPSAATVPRRTGSRCIDAATGTKNSMIETAGAMPVPETTASAQGAIVLDGQRRRWPAHEPLDDHRDQAAAVDSLGKGRSRHDQRDDVRVSIARTLEERRGELTAHAR